MLPILGAEDEEKAMSKTMNDIETLFRTPVQVTTTPMVRVDQRKQLTLLLDQIQEAFGKKDWATKDRLTIRALALSRAAARQGGGAHFMIGIAFSACRAFHALQPDKMQQHLPVFQAELMRHLAGIKLPEALAATIQKARVRANSARRMSSGVEKTLAQSAQATCTKKTGQRRTPQSKAKLEIVRKEKPTNPTMAEALTNAGAVDLVVETESAKAA